MIRNIKIQSHFLLVCGVIFFSHIAGAEPAPESAKVLARAAVASITNALGRLFPDERDRLLADAQPALAYYQQVLATTNWNEFITSTSPVPHVLHMTFQFYFGVRTNFDDLDPWERLTLIHTLPIGEAGLEPHDKRSLAIRDKQLKLTWLNTFSGLGPEQVLTRCKHLSPSMTLGHARRIILELFEQPLLLETLSIEDLRTVMHCVDTLRRMGDADLQKIALDRAAITGTQPDTNWIGIARTFIHAQYLPHITSIVLSPEKQNRPLNTNLVSAWLEPVGVWAEDQCWKLEQLWTLITNIYKQGLYRLPVSGYDRRPIYRYKGGLEALVPVMANVSRMITPTPAPRQPPALQPDDKQMLRAVQAYRPFDPESRDLKRALEAANRGDLDVCGETLIIEFAFRNLYHPLDLLGQWAERLPENRAIAESLTNIVTRLNHIAQGLSSFGVTVPSPPYKLAESNR